MIDTFLKFKKAKMNTIDRSTVVVPESDIARRIYNFREQRIILDKDLASLYGVPTKALNQAVRRNHYVPAHLGRGF